MNTPLHFFKYYTAHVAKIVLSTRRVRWNSPLNFNDPFDCFFSIEPKFDLSLVVQKHQDRFLNLLLQDKEPNLHPENPYSEVLIEMRRVAKKIPLEELKKMLSLVFVGHDKLIEALCVRTRENWRRTMAEYRLFCVCETNDNLLLWAHYTSNHTGAVFQFECLKQFDVPLLAAKPVTYLEEAPGLATEEEWVEEALGLRLPNGGDQVWPKLVTTKARAWEHEKEWRAVTTRRPYENQGHEDVEFVPQEISKVFLGCRMSNADKSDILGLLSGPFAHVEAYQARQHPKMYKLEFDRIK